jgi:hypothetical protein
LLYDVTSLIILLHPTSSPKYQKLLYNVTYDSSGSVTGASGLMNVWLLRYNGTKVEGHAFSDLIAEDWEIAFIDIVVGDGLPEGMPDGAKIYAMAQRR